MISRPSVQPVRPTRPSVRPIKLALRARCVDAELDPGGRGKELVGKGAGAVRARLARGSILQRNPLERNF